jgi:hypothetical protein
MGSQARIDNSTIGSSSAGVRFRIMCLGTGGTLAPPPVGPATVGAF